MDTLNSEAHMEGMLRWKHHLIARAIDNVEGKHPRLARENAYIRSLEERPDVVRAVIAERLDVAAAMMSDCRTDPLNCGRCAFWKGLRKQGVMVSIVV